MTTKKHAANATRAAFLAEYRAALVESFAWAADTAKLDAFMEKTALTAAGPQTLVNLTGSTVAAQVWRTIGGPGRLTYKALRALPE